MTNVLDNISEKVMLLPLLYRRLVKKATPRNNIGSAQLHILILLNISGKLPMYDIADKMSVSKPNLTPLVDKLCELNYVERKPGELDRRVTFISLTKQGEDYIESYKQAMSDILGGSLASTSIQEQQKLGEALDIIIEMFNLVN